MLSENCSLLGTDKGRTIRNPGRGGGGGDNSQKKFLQGKFFQKKNSCKQGKVINQNENQSDFNLHFDRY